MAQLQPSYPVTDIAASHPEEARNPTGTAAQQLLISILAEGHVDPDGSVSVAYDLLALGVSPDATSDGDRALLVAAGYQGCERATAMLLRAGADPNGISTSGGTPLAAACWAASPERVRLLLEGGADPNAIACSAASHTSPLMACASEFGDDPRRDAARLECARLLIAAGADLELRDQAGRTALRYAVIYGDVTLPFSELLLAAGAFWRVCPQPPLSDHVPVHYLAPSLLQEPMWTRPAGSAAAASTLLLEHRRGWGGPEPSLLCWPTAPTWRRGTSTLATPETPARLANGRRTSTASCVAARTTASPC